MYLLILAACIATTPASLESSPASCAACEPHGDGTYTIHAYPSRTWFASEGVIDNDGELSPVGWEDSMTEAYSVLPVRPGERLLSIDAEAYGNVSVLIGMDPPWQGDGYSVRWAGGMPLHGVAEEIPIADDYSVVLPETEYTAVVIFPFGADGRLISFDILVEE